VIALLDMASLQAQALAPSVSHLETVERAASRRSLSTMIGLAIATQDQMDLREGGVAVINPWDHPA